MTHIRTRFGTSTGRPALLSAATLTQPRWWSVGQWRLSAAVFVIAFLLIGEIGQTLPPESAGRMYPIEWWNWVTLLTSAALIGLIAATFAVPGGRRGLAGAGSGSAGTVAAVVMACPVCSPLAIPLLGTGGFLAFLVPDRGWVALASVVLLALTLLLRLRAATTCAVNLGPTPASTSIAPDAALTQRP